MILWLIINESWLFLMVYRVISKTPFNWFFILFLKPLLYLRILFFGACRTCISRNCITGVILITVLLSNKVLLWHMWHVTTLVRPQVFNQITDWPIYGFQNHKPDRPNWFEFLLSSVLPIFKSVKYEIFYLLKSFRNESPWLI